MFFKLFFLFVTVPLIELAILLVLGSERYGIGLLPTIAIVILTGLGGAWLARLQGFAAFRRIREDLAAGRMPTDAMTDALLIFLAGAFLMTPGILTDLAGFTLLVPAGRTLVKYWLFRWFKTHFDVESFRAARGEGAGRGDVIESYTVSTSSGGSASADSNDDSPAA